MHSELIAEIKKVARVGTCASMLPDVYRSSHFVAGESVVRHALAWRKEVALANARPAVPSSSEPPFKLMTLTMQIGQGPAVYWLLQEKDGGVAVNSFSRGYMVKIGKYWAGKSDVRVEYGAREGWQNAALAAAGDEEKMNVIAAVAWVVAVMNTPGMVNKKAVKPNGIQRSKVRKILGQAALAWTNVEIIPMAVHGAMRNESGESGRTVALHRRRGNFAWVPSQRRTSKSVWLTDAEAPLRGKGWYVWRDERLVGSDKAGVKVQRHVSFMPGSPRPDLSSEGDAAIRNAALGESQRAMLVKAGLVPSQTLH